MPLIQFSPPHTRMMTMHGLYANITLLYLRGWNICEQQYPRVPGTNSLWIWRENCKWHLLCVRPLWKNQSRGFPWDLFAKLISWQDFLTALVENHMYCFDSVLPEGATARSEIPGTPTQSKICENHEVQVRKLTPSAIWATCTLYTGQTEPKRTGATERLSSACTSQLF